LALEFLIERVVARRFGRADRAEPVGSRVDAELSAVVPGRQDPVLTRLPVFQPQALLTAVRKVLQLSTRFHDKIDDLSDQIREDYDDARRQAKVNFWASLGVSVAGIVIIFIGISLAMGGIVEVGIISALAGLVAEVASLLFFRRTDSANGRMDRYHLELLETRRFENLLAAGDELQSLDNQERAKENVINAATKRWLKGSDGLGQIESKEDET